MQKSALEALKEARELIEDPNRWCVFVLAKTSSGAQVSFLDKNAVKFCAFGAIFKVNKLNGFFVPGFAEINKAAVRMGYRNAVDINNTQGHAKTLEMFDLAICIEECKMKECENAEAT